MNLASTFRSLFPGAAFAIGAVTAPADTKHAGADIVASNGIIAVTIKRR